MTANESSDKSILLWYIYNRLKVTFHCSLPFCSTPNSSFSLATSFGFSLADEWDPVKVVVLCHNYPIWKYFPKNKCWNLEQSGISGHFINRFPDKTDICLLSWNFQNHWQRSFCWQSFFHCQVRDMPKFIYLFLGKLEFPLKPWIWNIFSFEPITVNL